MAQKKRKLIYIVIIFGFLFYFLAAARPIPREIILAPSWISSLGSVPVSGSADFFADGSADSHTNDPALINLTGNSYFPQSRKDNLLPFSLGLRFGFVDASGQFALNRINSNDIYLSPNMWTEYEAEPSSIVINNIYNNQEIYIENPVGYPLLLDNRIFLLGSEQNALSEIDNEGNIIWTYEFGAPLTAIDAAAGFVVTGSLDGLIEVFDSYGTRIFHFEPDGSRYAVILGCAISHNGSRIGIISGIDQQRFLLLERLGNDIDYKVVYHEFLDTGFRRPVRVSFIDDDQRIVYERMGGIGCYNIRSRRAISIQLDGEIAAFDQSGEEGFFFVITSHGPPYGDFLSNRQQMKLVGIKFPPDKRFELSRIAAQDTIFIKAQFKSDDVFLGRTRTGGFNSSGSSMLIAGGGSALISFVLEEK